mgnify:CR=1 FL=1
MQKHGPHPKPLLELSSVKTTSRTQVGKQISPRGDTRVANDTLTDDDVSNALQ